MTWTRRAVIEIFGRAGGLAGATAAMHGLGALAASPSPASASPAPRGAGGGKSVVILGGGVAGLVAAYELEQAGFTCQIIEARGRAGGRNWTWRDGDRVPHHSGEQTVSFDGGQYFNAGAARLPSFHHHMLAYCRRFDVALEPFIYENLNGYFQSEKVLGGQPIRHRYVRHSVQGAVDEMLAKSMKRRMLDQPATLEDFEKIEAFLGLYSGRAKDARFVHDWRGGFARDPGAGMAGPETLEPISLKELANCPALAHALASYDFIEWQPSLMQPVGGMDRIIAGFLRNLATPVRFDTAVKSIRQTASGVEIVASETASTERRFTADYCVCALPLPPLARIEAAWSPEHAAAIKEGAGAYGASSKIAWRADRRFWEEDDGIYGGASSLDHPVTQFWYPSHGFHSKGGVFLGCYNAAEAAEDWAPMSLEAQLASAREAGSRVHRAFASEARDPVAINWTDQPYNEGAWGVLADHPDRQTTYQTLLKPDGRIYFAGEHLSYLYGWQEGAALSSLEAVAAIATRAVAEAA